MRFLGRLYPALALALAACVISAGSGGCSQEKAADKAAEGQGASVAATPAAAEEKAGGMTKEPAKAAAEIAVVETNLGTFKIKFFPDVAPKAVENFIGLSKKGYYTGVTFHRVIDGFMIQGGDPTGTGRGGESLSGKMFEDEFSPKHRFDRKGLLAMANRGPNTNGSQFFITLAPTPHLNDRHTIFGEVVAGMDVIEKIGKVKTGQMDKPVDPVKISKITFEKPAEAK